MSISWLLAGRSGKRNKRPPSPSPRRPRCYFPEKRSVLSRLYTETWQRSALFRLTRSFSDRFFTLVKRFLPGSFFRTSACSLSRLCSEGVEHTVKFYTLVGLSVFSTLNFSISLLDSTNLQYLLYNLSQPILTAVITFRYSVVFNISCKKEMIKGGPWTSATSLSS